MFKNTALYVAERACPSISYRIRKEIFHEDISKPDMQLLQTRILINRAFHRCSILLFLD